MSSALLRRLAPLSLFLVPLLIPVLVVAANAAVPKTHHHKKKNGQATAATKSHVKTFTITANTKIQVGGKNQTRPANLNALHKGEHVVVLAHNRQADVITIHHHKKKKAA